MPRKRKAYQPVSAPAGARKTARATKVVSQESKDPLKVPELGVFVGDLALAKAHAVAAKDVLYFISQGLATASHTPVDLSAFEAVMMARLLDAATGNGLVPDMRMLKASWGPGAWDTARVQAHVALLLAFKKMAIRHDTTAIPPWVGFLEHTKQVELAEKVTGHAPLDAPKETDPLKMAYEMAKYNRMRAEQRLNLLYALGDAVRGRRGDMGSAICEQQYAEASTALWRARMHHITEMLALGTLLGGDALKETKAFAKRMYGPGKHVMSLVEIDGRSPSRWMSDSEDALREAIAKG